MSAETTHTAEAIVERIFDVSRWTDFTGYGPIPGIRSVAVEPGPDGRTATRFFVTNTDGSQHRETVIDYQPGRRLVLRMDGFSAPLRHLAARPTRGYL